LKCIHVDNFWLRINFPSSLQVFLNGSRRNPNGYQRADSILRITG
jgi:hypothetical protein